MIQTVTTKEKIQNEVRAFIQNLVRNDFQGKLEPTTKILSQQVVDSLGIIQLVAFLESTYKIKIDQAELTLDNLDSIEQVTNYLQRKLG